VVRVWTNIRAYLDIGFSPRVILVNDESRACDVQGLPVPMIPLAGKPARPSVLRRLAFRLRRPLRWELDYSFPDRPRVRRAILANESRFPGSVHHFEYVATAVAALPGRRWRTVFSSLDLESHRTKVIHAARQRMGARHEGAYRDLRQRSILRAERLVVANSDVVLSIANHECNYMREAWGARNAILFPLSWPVENLSTRTRPWVHDGELRVLHLGSVDGLLGFHSLEFLLTSVYPLLAPHTLAHTHLDIVGRVSQSPLCERIRHLAQPFPNVRFHGFQEHVEPFFASNDLQIVASPAATGLRTRIVESFVRGLPALSSPESALGLVGIEHGINILLASSPREFAHLLTTTVREPGLLAAIAREGRATYEKAYSRSVAAETLKRALTGMVAAAPRGTATTTR